MITDLLFRLFNPDNQETQDNPHRQFNPIFSRRAAVELQPE